MNQTNQKLTNLQLELLKLFRYEVSPEQSLEIKTMLGRYFAEKARDQMDNLWDERGWTEETMHQWANEHMRTPYKPES